MLPEDTEPFQPSRPQPSPFSVFAMKKRDSLIHENPTLSNIDISLKLASMWSNLSIEQRNMYSEESFVHRYQGFSFVDEPEKSHQPISPESQITEAIINSAEQISALEQPTDYDSYLVWLGTQVVSQFYNAHGYLPREINDLLLKGGSPAQPVSLDLKQIFNNFRKAHLTHQIGQHDPV
ncbi:hypothetical protein TRFO_08724 [Tritrichomonas foetus]|uniref:HMG box domain-containing protein n=1 Tax=Tritrichomonas foetus TaxID=1144522 RepID=A0A1J4JK31_9EUKA|nr:hypothetical protein TRFO_08724 [Tritrichomonas foetus]|eukprot:OHS98727.1 hypothetical protein TRFO_08724 [Tritrichomonas foetus]